MLEQCLIDLTAISRFRLPISDIVQNAGTVVDRYLARHPRGSFAKHERLASLRKAFRSRVGSQSASVNAILEWMDHELLH